MELLEIETIDFNEQTLEATFDGLFSGGFTVKTKFDFDKVLEEEAVENELTDLLVTELND